MRIKVISLVIFAAMMIGCQKQSEQEKESANLDAKVQFAEADQKISEYLDLLDDHNADKEQQTQVLCKEYPMLYETKYMPALLRISPNDYSKETLLKDLKLAMEYYESKLQIDCNR
ncbi:hypothetical protein EC846_2764 [Acinetobacter sp. BIGb0102]|uniref:hypothetical protein n=1 Tax=Acinetobacter sp. BIGb0102 TaxID=2485131 RepID=UPI000F4E75DD|nr:hypothetical protein [Acinetobacter sp. BIGb0102]RPE28318.1 hypothetical protein EC846_2764 [Acinetobacter sp. BIGb0102]